MIQRACRLVFALACVATAAVPAAAQELIAQPHCDLVLIDIHSLRDDITVRAQAVPDAPYLYKGWTQTQKAELSASDQFALLRIWDRALTEEARVESETWQIELMPTAPTALVVRSQGGSGTYELAGMPLCNLSVFGQATKFRFTFARPGSQKLDLAWASVYDGELDLVRFLNARPQHVVLRVLGSKVRLDLTGEPFAGEAQILVTGKAGSLEVVARRDVGLRVQAPPAVLRAFAAPHLSGMKGGVQSSDYESAACRVALVVEEAMGGVRVTWEGAADATPPAAPNEAADSAPTAPLPTTEKEFEAQIAAFLVLAARRDYDAAVERLRMLEDLHPGDARLLFLETWLRAHPNLQFDVVPVLGEAERFFRDGLDYYVAGQREEALLRFREAVKTDPKLESAKLWAQRTAAEIEMAQATPSTMPSPSVAQDSASPAVPPTPQIVVRSAPPLFAMRSPDAKVVATRADRIEFTGRVADDVGIDRIDITLNGAPVPDRLGEPVAIRPRPTDPDSSRELAFRFAVPLRPGANEIVLTAVDIDATLHRTSESFTVLRQPPFYRTGTFALILGGIVILGTAAVLVFRVVRPRGQA